MRYVKVICLLIAAVVAVSAPAKKPKDKNKYGVYLAGVSASFADSLVFFTDIQYVDSAAVDDNDMLVSRASYSIQLKDYLEQKQGEKNRTCFMFFNRKKAKLQKEMKKLRAEQIDYAFLPIDGIYNMNAIEAARCAEIIGAKCNVPVHMKPGELFSQEMAESFHAENRLILRPGQTITW